MTFFTKAEWGSRYEPNDPVLIKRPVSFFFVHHSATLSANGPEFGIPIVKSIQRYHVLTRNMTDIAYNFLVDSGGNVYQGHGWGRRGDHTAGYNLISYAVCALGDFNKDKPTQPMIEAIARVIREGIDLGFVRPTAQILPHNWAVRSTACPGHNLTMCIPEIRRLVAEEPDLTEDEHQWLKAIYEHITMEDLQQDPATGKGLSLRWAVNECLTRIKKLVPDHPGV